MNILKTNNYKILLVDDEQDILDILNYNLSKEGYNIICAENGVDALDKMTSDINLIILDVMMPQMDGLEFCKIIKSKINYKHIPIIFLTAKDNEIDEIIGLEIGADDYIYKPISIRKLKARIKVLLRRNQGNDSKSSKQYICNNLLLDYENYRVYIKNNIVNLTTNEMKILFLLSRSPKRFFTRQEILNILWKDVIVSDRTVDTHIVSIRAKLENYSNILETKRGLGYSFNPSLYVQQK